MSSEVEPWELFANAERHGVAGVVTDLWKGAKHPIAPELDRELSILALARELDHTAHLALLATIDARFAEAGLDGVVLKGPVFAERFYARPASRATSDLDLLVDLRELDRAADLLKGLGFVAAAGPEEERVRREHHHLHFSRPDTLPLELHFHGYAAFGEVLPSAPLLARRRALPALGFRALGSLSPEDELVFLAVHAAAHRFVRLGWLYDLRLLIETMNGGALEAAAERAAEWGFSRVLAFAASLLVERLDTPPSILDPLGGGGSLRSSLARRAMPEPRGGIASSATRLLYTIALCDDEAAAARYALRNATRHARRILGAGR